MIWKIMKISSFHFRLTSGQSISKLTVLNLRSTNFLFDWPLSQFSFWLVNFEIDWIPFLTLTYIFKTGATFALVNLFSFRFKTLDYVFSYIDWRRMYLIVVYSSDAFKELIFLNMRKPYKGKYVHLYNLDLMTLKCDKILL